MGGDLCLKSLEKLLARASVARKAVEFCSGYSKNLTRFEVRVKLSSYQLAIRAVVVAFG